MSSRTLSSFWKEHASETRPGNCSSTSSSTCSGDQDSSSAGGCRLAAKQHLQHRVAAQAETQGLERDDLLGRDVAEVDVRPEVLHEPGLGALRRRLEDQVVDRDLMRDLVDQARAHVAILAED